MTFDLPMGRNQPRAWRWVVATVVAVVLSLVACAVLVVIGKAVFPSTVGYEHYAFADYGKLTIIGVVLACVAWPAMTLVSSRAVRPFLLLTVVVTIVGLAPDAYILFRGQSPQAVLILVFMHIALALITFPTLVLLALSEPASALRRESGVARGPDRSDSPQARETLSGARSEPVASSPERTDHGHRHPGDTRAHRVPTVVRWLIPALLVVAWVAIGGVGGPYFGKISEVSSNDQTSYLPGSAQSTEVQKIQQRFTSSDEIPAIVVFERSSSLTSADKQYIAGRVSAASSLTGVAKGTSPAIVSKDGRAAQVFVPITNNTATADTVAALAKSVTAGAPSGLKAYVTGPAGQIADLGNAFAGIDGILLLVAVLAVLVILIVVYRSPLLPLFVLGTSLFALCASIFTVWWLAKSGAVTLNGQVQGILFILVIGAATDYSLLYVSRYREALRETPSRWDATWAALKGSIEPIAASAGTVIAGLLCLLLSELNSNRALGPVAAIGIVFAFVSAMTFLPALLLLAGRTAFWPLRPKVGSATATAASHEKGLWARLGRGIGKRPRTIWVITGIVLVAAALGVTQLRASGVAQSDLVEGYSAARTGQTVLGEHFPKGAGSPVLIVAKAGDLQSAADTALRSSGVSSVAVLSKSSPSGTLPVTTSGVQSFGSPTGAAAKPTEVAGQVLLEATLSSDPDSDAAQKTVNGLRSSYKGTGVLVGGVTATAIDSNDAGAHDRNLIIPVVLVVILLILMLLLRAVVAAVLLILSVVVSFAASLGVAALVFNGVFGFPGADPAVPLYGFVFLVALGVDYNIFLMTRVREESRRLGTRPGVLRGLSVTGGVITSAGIVLAATFAALSVIPVLFLTQIAFIVSFGVLLDTIVVRSLLVPALMYDVGSRIWWPSSLARETGARDGASKTTD